MRPFAGERAFSKNRILCRISTKQQRRLVKLCYFAIWKAVLPNVAVAQYRRAVTYRVNVIAVPVDFAQQ